MPRLIRRILAHHGKARPDGPLGCMEQPDIEFLHFAWNWNKERQANHLSLIQGFTGRKVIFHGWRGQKGFIMALGAGTHATPP